MLTPGSLIEKKCSSKPAVDRGIQKVRKQVATGVSRVTGFSVYEWDKVRQTWKFSERTSAKVEAK